MSYRSERSVRRETLEIIAALADDTARKMNGETAENPNAGKEYDQQYLLEDLLTRLGILCADAVPDYANLFPNAAESHRPVPAYELLIGDAEEETTEPARGVVSMETIRQAHNLLHFDGVQRHPFVSGPVAAGNACRKLIDAGDRMTDCGFPADHAIHDWREVASDA